MNKTERTNHTTIHNIQPVIMFDGPSGMMKEVDEKRENIHVLCTYICLAFEVLTLFCILRLNEFNKRRLMKTCQSFFFPFVKGPCDFSYQSGVMFPLFVVAGKFFFHTKRKNINI